MASTGEPFGLFWNSEGDDRTYDANSFEYWLKKFFTSGIFEGDLQVRASSGMTLIVGTGYANVDGKVKFWNAEFNLTLSPANSTYPRIDTVVITRDNVNRNITCEVVTGAYSGDTPQPTAPVRNAEIYQLVLAQIRVNAGVTEVTQANITDTRQNTELCGYITGTVTEMDFSQFVAQFESYFAQFKSQHESDWSTWEQTQVAAYNAWFANVQAQQVADKAAWDAWYADLQEELHNLPPDTAEYLQIQIDEIRNSGTTGSIFHVTTTNTELEGKTLTVSCGSETRTATFDANLECTVVGFKSVGNITFTSTDGIQTATKVVDIDYYSKYEVSIAFWSATVNIQGDTNLKGATVTVKDSDDTTVGTVTLNAVTAQGTFTATKADTYTFSVTYDGNVYSEELAVTQETTYTLQLATIPEGSTVTPINDIQIWLHCAGIFDKTYTTIGEVLADNTTLLALISDHNAVDYMVRSTSWASAVVANSTAMGYIGNNDYCADKLLSDSTWLTAIYNSTYFESVLNVKVPTMTSNTTPSGEAFVGANAQDISFAYRAFNNDTTNGSYEITDGTANRDGYVGYKFPQNVKIYMVKFVFAPSGGHSLSNAQYKIQGSNDGTNWIDLYTGTASTYGEYIHGLNSVGSYKYYRIWESKGLLYYYGTTYYSSMLSLQFYGRT